MEEEKIIERSKASKPKRKSPFRNVADLEKEITRFMNIHKAAVAVHATRLSDYFEMSSFNYIVKFYKARGYDATTENLQAGKYKYKFSTQGNQINFSNFKVRKVVKGSNMEFGIYHNLAAQSSHQKDIYTTPDIVVAKDGEIKIDNHYYQSSRKLYYVPNDCVISFFEAKHYVPFSELMFGFIGTVNELLPKLMTSSPEIHGVAHLAPSLMISGKPNEQAKKIKQSLEKRYFINIIFDLFTTIGHPFSTRKIRELRIYPKTPMLMMATKASLIEQPF